MRVPCPYTSRGRCLRPSCRHSHFCTSLAAVYRGVLVFCFFLLFFPCNRVTGCVGSFTQLCIERLLTFPYLRDVVVALTAFFSACHFEFCDNAQRGPFWNGAERTDLTRNHSSHTPLPAGNITGGCTANNMTEAVYFESNFHRAMRSQYIRLT